MAIFAVLAEKPDPELGAQIAALYPTDHFQLAPTQWLVSANAIAKDLAQQLNIREGERGRVIVLRASETASGWHKLSLWEWLKQKSANGS